MVTKGALRPSLSVACTKSSREGRRRARQVGFGGWCGRRWWLLAGAGGGRGLAVVAGRAVTAAEEGALRWAPALGWPATGVYPKPCDEKAVALAAFSSQARAAAQADPPPRPTPTPPPAADQRPAPPPTGGRLGVSGRRARNRDQACDEKGLILEPFSSRAQAAAPTDPPPHAPRPIRRSTHPHPTPHEITCTVASRWRGRSSKSIRTTCCQVPRARRPSTRGIVSEGPIRAARRWAWALVS